MFGVILSGRLVQTAFQQVGEKQFLTSVECVGQINHLVVFLTGVAPFPEGLGGLVYFSLPDPVNPPAWHLLGFISNDKPSAIFKVSGLKSSERHLNADGSQFEFGASAVSREAQIGIAVDSLASIQQQCPSAIASSMDSLNSPVALQFCRKMLENLVNYTTSFCVTQAQMTLNPTETYVPLSSIQAWFTNFERKLLQNPEFWRE